MNTYTVLVNFATYIGADNEYIVSADSEEDAEQSALEKAELDLEVIDIEDLGDGEYEVTVGFAGFIGVEEIYKVYADDEDEASENALEEAKMDLTPEIVDDEDF